MQKCPIYLYPNLLDVILDLDQNTRIHNIMYQRDIKIQKGLKNRVQLQFKNSDQKMLPISTGTFVFSMFNGITQQTVVKKVVSIVDDGVTTSTRGLAVVELSETDTLDLDAGTYQFTVSSIDADGGYQPTYADTYYGTNGRIELRQDSFPLLQPTTEVSSFQAVYNNGDSKWNYYSGRIQAHPEFNGNSALHTIALYMTNYTGSIQIQGTQNNSPEEFGGYAILETRNYTKFTGIDYVNFYGVWTFVRTKHIPATDPVYLTNDHTTDSYHGTLDKILYRS
jgi:hypothetical protein